MRLAVRQSTGTKKAANLRVRTATGTKSAANAYIRTAGGLKLFFTKFSVSTDQPGTSASFNSGTSADLTTRDVTVLVKGAVGTITYAWSQLSGDPITIDHPAAASTSFSATVDPGETLSGVFKCTVTDASGHSADTPNVSVRISNRYGGVL